MQLLRLKKAQVARPPGSEEDSLAQLETAKWLHLMTDAVMALQAAGAGAASEPPRPRGPPTAGYSNVSPIQEYSVPRGGAVASPGGYGDGLSRTEPYGASAAAAHRPRNLPPTSGLVGSMDGFTPEARMLHPDSGQFSRGGFLLGQRTDGGSQGPSQKQSAPTGSASGSAVFGGVFAGKEVWSPSCSGSHSQADSQVEPMSEPGTFESERIHATANRSGDPGEADGLVLGKGSWATAYRQATGTRKDCFRLLCKSGIVTARELGNDLTVISEEHMDECILIAAEMLRTWTLDMWAQQPEEAKIFFEARLTAMYQRKFGEGHQKGEGPQKGTV